MLGTKRETRRLLCHEQSFDAVRLFGTQSPPQYYDIPSLSLRAATWHLQNLGIFKVCREPCGVMPGIPLLAWCCPELAVSYANLKCALILMSICLWNAAVLQVDKVQLNGSAHYLPQPDGEQILVPIPAASPEEALQCFFYDA